MPVPAALICATYMRAPRLLVFIEAAEASVALLAGDIERAARAMRARLDIALKGGELGPAIVPGKRVTLTGLVRGVHGAVLQRSTAGTPWQQFRTISHGGVFHVSVKPKVTTEYRLATATDAAAPVRIRVKAATVK